MVLHIMIVDLRTELQSLSHFVLVNNKNILRDHQQITNAIFQNPYPTFMVIFGHDDPANSHIVAVYVQSNTPS